LLYYEGTAQDITERRRAEDALRKQTESLQKILDHLPMMIRLSGQDGKTHFVNRGWEETLGWTLEEVQNNQAEIYAKMVPEDERERVQQFVKSASGEWKDFRTRLRDGRTIDTSWAVVSLSEGVSIGIGQDITERKRADEALREAEQKYRELFENAKDAMYVHDLEGRYVSVNRAAEELSGYSREEILGKHFVAMVAPEYVYAVKDHLSRKLGIEGETSYEVEVISKDGRRIPVEVSSRLIRKNGVAIGVQGTARDITERKLAAQVHRQYSRRLIQAQEEERQRIARELHDQIGQILTAVQFNLHTVQRLCPTSDAAAHVDDGIRVLDEALEQVRDLSLDLRPALLDDLGLVPALRWYLGRQARRTGLKPDIFTDLPHADLRFTRDIETACFRIAQEALTNVARHARATKVTIHLGLDDSNLRLAVNDNGVGFDADALRKRVLGAPTLGFQGMQERAEAVKGSFWIVSAPGKGTEVNASFPVKT
jgi:PAS domain S-box-containing protein